MSYRAMNKRDLWEIYRRWQSRQTLSQIAGNEGRDRKTVRQYLRRFAAAGLEQTGAALEQQRLLRGGGGHAAGPCCSSRPDVGATLPAYR